MLGKQNLLKIELVPYPICAVVEAGESAVQSSLVTGPAAMQSIGWSWLSGHCLTQTAVNCKSVIDYKALLSVTTNCCFGYTT